MDRWVSAALQDNWQIWGWQDLKWQQRHAPFISDGQLDIGSLALMNVGRCVVFESIQFRYSLVTYLESGAVKKF